MKLYIDFDIESFNAWSGAIDTKESITNAGKAELFNALVDDIFPDGCTETEMNDFLWFDSASIYEMLGLNEDGEEPEEDDEEPETINPAEFKDFQDLCAGRDCQNCPLWQYASTDKNFDCEEYFSTLKGGATA